MAFNCNAPDTDTAGSMKGDHSHFGEAYSVRSRSTTSFTNRYHNEDEPEADYDEGSTILYQCIENKDWDGALSRLEESPREAKTWVFRRESNRKMRWRLLPIHAVCIFRAPMALIEALVEVYADGPKMKDDQGMLPVHLACRNGASKGVVLTMLSAFPDAVNVRDRKGRTPMDLVESSSSANKEVVLAAMNRFSKQIKAEPPKVKSPTKGNTPTATEPTSTKSKEVGYEDRTILFRLILKKEWKSAVDRANKYPEEASTWIVTKGFHGSLRFLPLHKACVLDPPAFLIDALIRAYPEAAADRDQDGWLPIHCACFYGAGSHVINALLKASNKGSQTKDDEGRLPIHYACLKGATKQVVDVLLASYAKGAMSKDGEGRLPIHHACSKGAPDAVVDALLKVSPKSSQCKDDQGRLPLHHACRKRATEKVVRALLRNYPRAAQVKDDQDKLPIHYACQHGATPATVSILLTTYPESIDVKNGFGYTPLAEAKAQESNGKTEPVIKVLEKFKKEQDKLKKNSKPESSDLDRKVTSLKEQVTNLEKTLSQVENLGQEMRQDLKNKKDPSEVLEKFADRLIQLGGAQQAEKAPLKSSKQGKGLFGRRQKAN